MEKVEKMNTSENKQARDYSHEHNLRTKKKKRYVVELTKEKGEQLEAFLLGQGLTYSEWIRNIIEGEIK